MRNLNRAAIVAIVAGAGLGLAAMPALADVPCASGAPVVAQRAGPPPPLVREVQPPMPAYGYNWTPGYWGWNPVQYDYYWVPGVWVLPPAIGLLWTPPWWGWVGGVYVLTPGYWGPTVGFYGGIDYGFGYGGFGYDGGYWRGRTFYYNRAVNNLGGLHVNAAYNSAASVNRAAGLKSFNGGPRGVRASATTAQLAAARSARSTGTAAQAGHVQSAAADPAHRAGAMPGRRCRGGRSGGRRRRARRHPCRRRSRGGPRCRPWRNQGDARPCGAQLRPRLRALEPLVHERTRRRPRRLSWLWRLPLLWRLSGRRGRFPWRWRRPCRRWRTRRRRRRPPAPLSPGGAPLLCAALPCDEFKQPFKWAVMTRERRRRGS